jgi:hypothetical protein
MHPVSNDTDPAFGTKVKVNFPFDSSFGPVETTR